MPSRPSTPLLDRISSPQALKPLALEDLVRLAGEVRAEVIDAVSQTGGHLGSGLGVVELSVALHHVFDAPKDRLVWDVGHQCYPHKILTGRRDRIRTLRQGGGLSGFTCRTESPCDPFGAGHSSTSISAGLGMAVARDLDGRSNHVVCVIGDGAMSAGMAFEALNNAGAMNSRLIVILNDNDMSIAPPTGALSAYLSRLISSGPALSLRGLARGIAHQLPDPLYQAARRAEEYARGLITGGSLFEELGFYYVGPIDGHRLDHLLPVLRNVRDHAEGPTLIHVVTEKGKGFAPAEAAADKYHGVSRFNVRTGAQDKAPANARSYTSVFAETLIALASRDPKIVAVTAAMPAGTGLDLFHQAYPERTFDVGIAEQHAVTFAAGLAAEGYKPVVAIYSTFLQRAYDQVIHDVALQSLPVRFAVDRAGLVGADGATHQGAFDLAYLCCVPNMTIMAPSDENELACAVATALSCETGPTVFRFPRGEGSGVKLPDAPTPFPVGKGRLLRQGRGVALLGLGAATRQCLEAATMLAAQGIEAAVADARFAKPLDLDLLERLAQEHDVLVVVEEGAQGGFGALTLRALADAGRLDAGTLKVRTLTLPDRFLPHDTPEAQRIDARLDANSIAETVVSLLGKKRFSTLRGA